MLESLFERPGEKLKKVATILFWVNVIVFIILAFKFGLQKYHYDYYGYDERYRFLAIPFFGFLIGGVFGSYIECLCLSAFGEMITELSSIYLKLKDNNDYLAKINENLTEGNCNNGID